MTRPFTPEELGLDKIPAEFEEQIAKLIGSPAGAQSLDEYLSRLPQHEQDAIAARATELIADERQARAERLLRTLDELAEITDETDTDEIWADVFRGLDENRP